MLRKAFLGVILLASTLAGCNVSSVRPEAPSEEAYRALRIGMSCEEVLERVGPPDYVKDPQEAWWYQLGDDHGPCYRIGFSEDRVARIQRFDCRRGSDELDPRELGTLKPIESP
jgi:hypothetical protein